MSWHRWRERPCLRPRRVRAVAFIQLGAEEACGCASRDARATKGRVAVTRSLLQPRLDKLFELYSNFHRDIALAVAMATRGGDGLAVGLDKVEAERAVG